MTRTAAPERKWITKIGLACWIVILAVWNVAGWALYWWGNKVDLPVLGPIPLIALLFMAGAATAEVVGANFAIEVERAHHDKHRGRMWANVFAAFVFAAFNAYGSHNAYEQFLVRPDAAKAEIARTAALDVSTARLVALDGRIAAVPMCDPLALGPKALVECGTNRRGEIAALETERRAEQQRRDALPAEAAPVSIWWLLAAFAFFAAVEAVKMLSFWSIGAGRARAAVLDRSGHGVPVGTEPRPTAGTVVPFASRLLRKSLIATSLAFMALMGWTRGTQAPSQPNTAPVPDDTIERITGTEIDVGLSHDDKLADIQTLRERRVPWREIERITGVPKSTAWNALKRAESRATVSDRIAKAMTPLQGEAA